MSFAPDGRLLMSFSLGDGNIRLWQISSTFIASMLGNATKCLKTMQVALSPATGTQPWSSLARAVSKSSGG